MIVWIASYPRSGNTFFRSILKSVFAINTYSIYNDINDIKANPNLSEIIGHEHFDLELLEEFRNSSEIYFIKTHEIDVEIKDSDKIIYLIRDGREATLSFSNFMNNFKHENICFSDILDGCHSFGNWSNHVLSWLKGIRKPNLIIKFEKLITSPLEVAKEISILLNLEQKTNVIHSFESLKSIDNKFFCSGKTDSWKNIISEEEHYYYWLHSYDAMILSEYKNDMPSLFSDKIGLKLHTLFTKNQHQLKFSEINLQATQQELTIENSQSLQRKNEHEIVQKERLQALSKLNNAQQQIESLNVQLVQMNNDNERIQKKAHDISVQYRNFVVAMHAWQASPTLLAYLKFRKLDLPEIPEIISLNNAKNNVLNSTHGINLSEERRNGYYGMHRSGWSFAVSCLAPLQNDNAILFDSFVEKTFCWGGNTQAYSEPWIGITHQPHNVPQFLENTTSVNNFIDKKEWIESMQYCRGLFTMSEHSAKFWRNKYPHLKVNSLVHPTEFPTNVWTIDKFIDNKSKKIIQVGWYLRKLHAIFELPNSSYEKIALPGNPDYKSVFDLEQKELQQKDTFSSHIYETATFIDFVKNDEYDDFLSKNIVFVDLYDASANNTVVECIARATPLLINKLPAVIEYLGEDYPLYYNSYEHAISLAENYDALFTAHRYLLQLSIREKITPEYFRNSIVKSDVYKELFTCNKIAMADCSYKISIITPSLNNGDSIERAILSVYNQNYKNWEHIIIDGGSTDNTIDILKKYPHLKWISEPDNGQVDAMNKGFAISSGEIISYLNADDYYLEGAFSSVLNVFDDSTSIVYGKVKVFNEESNSWWVNDPKYNIHSVLRHWEADAFCVNPVGYFYKKEVQESIPYQEKFGAKMDLAFLMQVALKYEQNSKKVDNILGVFMNTVGTRTVTEQSKKGYWTPENFPFIDEMLLNFSERDCTQFKKEQEIGYKQREEWRQQNELARLKKENSTVYFPATEYDMYRDNSLKFCNPKQYKLAKGDTIAVVLTYGKCGSTTITRSLERVLHCKSGNVIPAYHLHDFNKKNKEHLDNCSPIELSCFALRDIFDKYKHDFNWCFICGVREFMGLSISAYFENEFKIYGLPSHEKLISYINGFYTWARAFNSIQYKKYIGIDLYSKPFDKNKGYQIIKQENISVLTYRMDKLNDIFSESMYELIGIKDVEMIKSNISADKTLENNGISYADAYAQTKANFRLDTETLAEMYNHEFMTHYFLKEEINEFIDKWSIKN